MLSEFNVCTSHNSTVTQQKNEAAIWQSFFFFFPGCRMLARAALLTGSLAESGLATKDVFHFQGLRCYLQEAATFAYLAPDKALCHSTVYHYQSQRIQGFFLLKWRAVWDSTLHIYSNTELSTIPDNVILTWTIFRFSFWHWNKEKRLWISLLQLFIPSDTFRRFPTSLCLYSCEIMVLLEPMSSWTFGLLVCGYS